MKSLAAALGTGYNDDDTRLDPQALQTILDWLRKRWAPEDP